MPPQTSQLPCRAWQDSPCDCRTAPPNLQLTLASKGLLELNHLVWGLSWSRDQLKPTRFHSSSVGAWVRHLQLSQSLWLWTSFTSKWAKPSAFDRFSWILLFLQCTLRLVE
jgi:hypothetical protein